MHGSHLEVYHLMIAVNGETTQAKRSENAMSQCDVYGSETQGSVSAMPSEASTGNSKSADDDRSTFETGRDHAR